MRREDDAGGLRRGRLCYFPVVPGRLEFTEQLRETLLEEKPAVVAVELPLTLESSYQRAVDRLPELSVMPYAPVWNPVLCSMLISAGSLKSW